jgi:RecA-family ATPase
VNSTTCPFEFIDLAKNFETEPPELDFVLPGFLAGTVGGLMSPGGVGKSTFALMVAIAIACGVDTIGLGLQRYGRVVMLAGEDPVEAIHHRMHALGAHLSLAQRGAVCEKLHITSCVGGAIDLTDERWFAQILEQAIDSRLLILDTLTRFHSLDENCASDAKKIMASMESIAAQTSCAILFLHHVNKSSAMSGMADLQQAARGSSVFVDNARWLGFVAGMTRDEAVKFGIAEDNRRRYIRWGISKQNYAPPREDSWLERRDGVLKSVTLTQTTKQISKLDRQIRRNHD